MSDTQAETPEGEEAAGENETHQLREAYKREKAGNEKGQSAVRELAFLRAGVDSESSNAAKFFAEHYDGDLEPEAIKSSFDELGLGGEPVPEPEPESTPDPAMEADQAAMSKVTSTMGSDPTPGPDEIGDPNPYRVIQNDFEKGREEGMPADSLYPKAVGQLFEAERKGDPRVMTSGQKQAALVQSLRENGINVD